MNKETLYLARTIYGEARGEPIEGKVAVANVIKNRTLDNRWPDTFLEVVTQRQQFSCWNQADPNRRKIQVVILEDPVWSECLWVAEGIFAEKIRDNTGGANHYFATSIEPPPWAKDMKLLAEIGRHKFFLG